MLRSMDPPVQAFVMVGDRPIPWPSTVLSERAAFFKADSFRPVGEDRGMRVLFKVMGTTLTRMRPTLPWLGL